MAKCTDVLYVKSGTDEFYLTGRSCELSAFSFIPKEHNEPKERVVYNSEKKVSFWPNFRGWLFTLDTA